MMAKIHHSRPTICDSDIEAVSKVLRAGYIANGKVTEKFERRFSQYIGVDYSVATNSGTSALHLALFALGIKKGDEIIVPSFVCTALLNAVLYVEAKPKVADIDCLDFNLSLEDTRKKITKKTKAIILPHMFGKPADIVKFTRLGVPVIENCAQSLGARYRGRRVGSFGDISIFSFYATKMITAGCGGMVSSRNRTFIGRIKDLINYDERNNYKIRFNYKMSDIAASLGMSQLTGLDSFIFKRRRIARFYSRNFESKNIVIPNDEEKNHIYFRYVIRVKGDIDRTISRFHRKGIEVKRPVFKPLHRYLGLDRRQFPNTEAVFNLAISLPIYPSLKEPEAEFIVKSLEEALR